MDHYQDSGTLWYPPALPDDKETTLLLAGDLWIGTKSIWYNSDSWLSNVAGHFKQVLIVLGNHDYWSQGDLTIKNGGIKFNSMIQDLELHNVKVLDCDTFLDGDYLFVGCTLWTDMNNACTLAMYNMPKFMTYDGKIKYDTGPDGRYSIFSSEKWVSTHYKHRKYLNIVAELNKDKKLIVITHHLPLRTLNDPNFSYGNEYYSSDLSKLILDNTNIKLWCYGHTHYQKDVQIEHCRLINNCVGYQGEHFEQEGLVKHEVIEV